MGYRCQIVYDPLDLRSAQSARGQVLRPSEHSLVLEYEGNRKQQFETTVQGATQKLS